MACGKILVMFWALFSTFNIADATSQETVILKVYNPDYQPSDKEIWAKLKEADLEGHGYKKEQTVKLASEPGSDKPVYKKKYYFYKIVDCSRLQEIIEELATLMPKDDPFDEKLYAKAKRDVNLRGVTNMKSCKVGLEVHFKDGNTCTKATDTSGRMKRKALGCWVCFGLCIGVEARS